MNCDTQTNLIKTFTQESLNNAIINMKKNFDNIKDNMIKDLIDGVRLDVYDKMYNSNDDNCDKHFINIDDEKKIEDGLFSGAIDNIINLYKLKKREKYIHRIYSQSNTIQVNSKTYYARRVLYGLITNYSNIYYIEYYEEYPSYRGRPSTNTREQIVNTYIHNIPLNNIYIEGIKAHSSLIGRYHARDDSRNETIHDNVINYYKSVLDLNKKNYIKLLAENDLREKYESLLKDNLKSQNNIKKMEEHIVELTNKLQETIPKEYQCCICFGFTDKKMLCSPCGHTQYCNKCIVDLKNCALCRKDIVNVVKIF
jgi:hypothetical protein